MGPGIDTPHPEGDARSQPPPTTPGMGPNARDPPGSRPVDRRGKGRIRLMFSPSTIAMDLGNANTRLYGAGRGVMIDEPSVITVLTSNNTVVAFGSPAKAMLGRSPAGLDPLHPLRHGVIYDPTATEKMMRCFLGMAHVGRRPRLLISVPAGTTTVERRSVEQATYAAGAANVTVIDEPLAAAIGVGLHVHRSVGGMLVDVGAGVTEAVVVSMGGLVTIRSARIAGDDMDQAIVDHVRTAHGVDIGLPTAERVKISIGRTAHAEYPDAKVDVVGVHRPSGLPRRITLDSGEIAHALEPTVVSIIEVVTSALEVTPPELCADLADLGLTLVGGMSRLPGLAERIADETAIATTVARRPERAVVDGSGRCVEDRQYLRLAAR